MIKYQLKLWEHLAKFDFILSVLCNSAFKLIENCLQIIRVNAVHKLTEFIYEVWVLSYAIE
jgi:hypothetical protein